jgi:predicted ribosome quality control (RQC) complex YloA/Tae2 family protein
MKQRFSSLDVKVIAHELSASLVSLRLANIYDLSSRIFLLKFAKPDRREQLLIDSGFRCHLTSFARSTSAAPSPFVSRLRKFLRTRRVTKIEQIGTDRVIELQFSDGQYRLFLEFYAGGNIVLTDAELTIIGLLRTVNEGAEHEQYRQGLKYGLSQRQNYAGVPELTKERVIDGLQKAVQKQEAEAQKPGKKIKKKKGDDLRKALAVTTHEFPPILIDHALYVTGYDRDTQPEQVIHSEELLDKLMVSLEEARNVVREITSAETTTGYIIAKRQPARKQAEDGDTADTEGPDENSLSYDDFHPFKPAQFASDSSLVFLDYEGFNKTADEFFSSLEGQKLESKLHEKEDNAKRRIEQARQEQAKRLDGLQQVQELNVRKAHAIEANIERVEEATAAVNGLIAQGMDWVDIGRLIGNEQARNNPVAKTIKLPLKLQENTITLLLSELNDAEDDDMADETDSETSNTEDESSVKTSAKAEDKQLAIDIDLAHSAWANARQYHENKRSAAKKQEKTAQASQKALKSTEQKVLADLKKDLKKEKEVLRPARKQRWFEKFIYFISSDKYLVLAGKDAQQNEILYRRYLKKGDIYVHADLHGAATVIIKNNPMTPEAPIPPTTLSQAGHLAVCTSSAWDSKAGMSAWWVTADQVSKTAPTGEYLTTGGFMVRGKKNFLPPAQLLLGFAVLFQISEESKARHVKHRLLDFDVPDTPELTDGETIAESSIAGDGSSSDGDDDFPDAVPGPSVHIAREENNYQDPSTMISESSDDDFPDARNDDEEEDEYTSRTNPLQTTNMTSTVEPNGRVTADPSLSDTSLREEQADISKSATLDDANSEARLQEEAEDNLDSQADGESEPLSTSTTSTVKPETPKVASQVRGKRGKVKKAAAKYANQDEEDREIAMRLLGSKAGDERRQAEAAEKATKKETAEEARARRREQHEKAQKQGLEAEEIRRLNLEEGLEELGEEEISALTQLDALVGTPLPGDEILDAIPICAPWSALAKYKYKAKMQPGQQKKGKAVREILGKWTKDANDTKKLDFGSHDPEKIWPREAELIKGLKEAEVVGIVPVKSVRVMMSGGSAGGDKGKGAKGGGKSGRGGRGGKRR